VEDLLLHTQHTGKDIARNCLNWRDCVDHSGYNRDGGNVREIAFEMGSSVVNSAWDSGIVTAGVWVILRTAFEMDSSVVNSAWDSGIVTARVWVLLRTASVVGSREIA